MSRLKAGWLRLRWVLVALLAAGIYIRLGGSEVFRNQFAVLSWKVVLLSVGLILADCYRRVYFPYVDLSLWLQEKTIAAAIVFVGMILFYWTVVSSLTAGL
jgi:hypothetical protein